MKKLKLSDAQKTALEQQNAQLLVTVGISLVSMAVITAVKAITEAKSVELPQSNKN